MKNTDFGEKTAFTLGALGLAIGTIGAGSESITASILGVTWVLAALVVAVMDKETR